MLLGPIGNPPLRFPSHGVLHQHMFEAILAFFVSDGKIFPRRFAVCGRKIGLSGREINDVDLRVRIVHRHADLHVMPQQAIGFYRTKNMPQCVWKNQRMLVDLRTVTRFFPRRSASLHDAEFKRDEFMLFLVPLHSAD